MKQDFEEEKLSKLLRQTLDAVSPDEEAKARMLERIQERRAAPTPQKRRIPWRTPLVATGALACAAVLLVVVYAQMPRGGGEQLPVEPVVTTLATTAATSTAAQTTATTAKTTATTAKTTATTAQTAETTIVTTPQTEAATTYTEITSPVTQPAYIATTAQTTAATETATTAQTAATTSPTRPTTKPQTAQTTAKPVETTTAAKTTAQTETTPDETSPGLQRDIHQYYRLLWNDVPYDTEYITVDSRAIEDYIGLAVTNSPDVDDTYVVLVYSIFGADTSDVLAVQYANSSEYYLFRRMV